MKGRELLPRMPILEINLKSKKKTPLLRLENSFG